MGSIMLRTNEEQDLQMGETYSQYCLWKLRGKTRDILKSNYTNSLLTKNIFTM